MGFLAIGEQSISEKTSTERWKLKTMNDPSPVQTYVSAVNY